MYQNVTFERSRHMFSIKLNSPVLLRKQLPVIAKALRVDEKVLEDFMTVSAFYGVKDGKGTIVPIKKTDTIVYIDYKAYDSCYFVVDAILQYAKDIDTSVTLPVITEIELGTDVFKKFSPVQLSDIMFLTRRLKDGNERVTKLAELNAPDILLANERALLCKNVESLEDNEHTPKPDRNIDGHVCASLHDIGYSILDGWLNKNDSAFESDGKNNSGYDPDKLAALVKKAIGTQTQEHFAQTSHTARVYINRLANGRVQSRPTEVTLKKIAKATDAVTENELRQACGYEPLPGEDVVESKKRIETVDDYTWIRENVNYFLEFLKAQIPMALPLYNLVILENQYMSIRKDGYDLFGIHRCSAPVEYSEDGTVANVFYPVTFEWTNYRRSIHLTAAVGLLGHYSKNDDLYITDYVTDVDTLYKYAPALRKPIDKLSENFKSSGVDIKDFPVFYYTINLKKAFTAKHVLEKMEKFLNSLVKVRVDALGFYTDNLSDETFIKFLKKHKKVMTNEYADSEIKDFYENVVVRHGDIEDFFAENSDYNSKAAIVAYVIQNEASDDTPRRLVDGFTFDDDDKKERPCVAASKREIETWQKEHPGNGFDLKVFSDTLKKYADELGLAFGDIYYYLDVEDDKADEMGVRV
jgi:transcriptional regulator with XRE-family HTH domain